MKKVFETTSMPRAPRDTGTSWWLRDDPPRYEALGRAGQRITVLPSLDAVVVFTGGGFEPSEVGDFVGRALRGDRLPEDPAGYAVLKEKVAAAARAPDPRQVPPVSSIAREISGKRYVLETNPMGVTSFSFTFGGGYTAVFHLWSTRTGRSRGPWVWTACTA